MKTIKELYDWAVSHGAVDFPVGLQYKDSGGSYLGDTFHDGVPVFAQIEEFDEQKFVLLS